MRCPLVESVSGEGEAGGEVKKDRRRKVVNWW